MQNKISGQPVVRFLVIFLVLSMILLILKNRSAGQDIDYTVLLAGNTILFLATILSFFFYKKALHNNNPHAFVRNVYGGMLLKMMICIAAALVYILLERNTVSKFALFGCFGLYIIYTFVEVKILMQLSKQQKDA